MSEKQFKFMFDFSSVSGAYLHSVVSKLFPICRSITGDGVRKSFDILGEHFIQAQIYEVPSGTSCFDWTIPDEWEISEAYLIAPDGEKVVDFVDNNLHVVSYSIAVDRVLALNELQRHLHSSLARPHAIPYVTSYYQRDWGFCLPHTLRKSLPDGDYHAVIRSEHKPGVLNYGEIVIPGESDKEVLITSYICHPSMANNELSGPVVAFALAKFLSEVSTYYTYRIAVFPETIGAIAYLSERLSVLQENVIAGFQLSCIGDDRAYSFISSPSGGTLADRVARHVYSHTDPSHKEYDFLHRGSDERQFCSPRVGLPLVTLMRTKFGAYPEYHTSDDDLRVVTPEGLENGLKLVMRCVEALESNKVYLPVNYGEPQLGKYGLRNTTSHIDLGERFKLISDVLAFSDGNRDLLDLSDRINKPVWKVAEIIEILLEKRLLKLVNE